MQKPDSATYCPASGKKLRLKDCVAVKFTRVREGESGLYMDPVTMETFTNASKLVVIAPTGEQGASAARRARRTPLWSDARYQLVHWIFPSYTQ